MKLLSVLVTLVVVLVSVVGCGLPQEDWALIDEGTLTHFEGGRGQPILTFNYTRVVIVPVGMYAFDAPDRIILGEHYCLYRESGWFAWNGYHLVKMKGEK